MNEEQARQLYFELVEGITKLYMLSKQDENINTNPAFNCLFRLSGHLEDNGILEFMGYCAAYASKPTGPSKPSQIH